jgi:glycosyltransferase involved in cell wall biosynthesis
MSSLSQVNVSIIVTCQEQRSQLGQLLPFLLSQHYDGEFEVIVVDMIHDKDTEEWLEEMEVHYPNLSHTFCPVSARGIDLRKLAFTLGAKAAIHEWLVFLSAGEGVPSGDWFSRLSACCGDGVDVVIGKRDRKRRWKWPLFRSSHEFSIFYPTTSILFCRRSILLQGDPHIPKERITRVPL